MTRGALAICLVLAAAGCGGGGDCTEGCQKIASCHPGTMTNLDQCVAECKADPGNQAMATCYASISGCDVEAQAKSCALADTTCALAMKKINDCVVASGSSGLPPTKFSGWCNDQVQVMTPAGAKSVAFRTWATTYLGCTVDPKTCNCPGQPWYTEL